MTKRIMAGMTAAFVMIGSMPFTAYADVNIICDDDGLVTEETIYSETPDSIADAMTEADDLTLETPDEEILEDDTEVIAGSIDIQELPDNGELLEGYINELVRETAPDDKETVEDIPAEGVPRSSLLNGNDLKVYNYLLAEIKKVAKGSRTITTIEIPISVFGVKETYSASELGLGSLNSESEQKQAMSKLNDKVSYDTSAVIYSLLFDCPYDLYWFDKTAGWLTMGVTDFFRSGNNISYKGNPTIRLIVEKSYSDGNTEYVTVGGSSTAYRLSTDSSKTKAASNTVNKAASVVADYKDYSDYEKLKAYKDWICDEVSYNNAAASGSMDYGDPWQVIYVFDGDPSTNVVCEGYAKAFKMLCDLSSFKYKKLDCYILNGTMTGATGSGSHMWNTVLMDDGKNYLVDVTNCDAGSVGSPDKLFLKGYSGVIGSADSGFYITIGSKNINYTYNSKYCGKVYTKAERTLSNSDYVPEIPKPAEKPEIKVQPQSELSLKYGDKTGQLTVDAVAQTGHTLSYQWYKYTPVTDPEGTAVKGATKSSFTVPAEDLGLSYYYCRVIATRKGSSESAYVNSEGSSVTVTARDAVITADNISKVIGQKDPELTVSFTGVVNGDKLSYTISREAGEELGTYVITPAGDAVQKDGRYNVTYKTGVFTITTCTHRNKITKNTKVPTCTIDGYTGDTYCTECNELLEKGIVIPRLGHDFDMENGFVTREATTYLEGLITYHCQNAGCEEVKQEVIPKKAVPGSNEEESLIDDLKKDGTSNLAATSESRINGSGENETVTKIKAGDDVISTTVYNEATGSINEESALWIGGLKESYEYTGSPIVPSVNVYDGIRRLEEKKDYTIKFADNKNIGKASVTVKFKGNYKGRSSITAGFTITKGSGELKKDKPISDSSVTCTGSESVSYRKSGNVLTDLILKDGERLLKENVDYTVKYKNNKAVTSGATAEAVIIGKGSYNGSRTFKFAINARNIASEGMLILAEDVVGDKSAKIKITDQGKSLSKSKDYSVTADGKDGSTYTMTIKGIGNYTGIKTVTYRSIEKTARLATAKKGKTLAAKAYTGRPVTLSLDDLKGALTDKDKTELVPGVDFVIAGYKNNNKAGSAKVILKGTGKWGGTKMLTFKILPKSSVEYKGVFIEGVFVK